MYSYSNVIWNQFNKIVSRWYWLDDYKYFYIHVISVKYWLEFITLRIVLFYPRLCDISYCSESPGFLEIFWDQSKLGNFGHLETDPTCLKSVQFYTFCIHIQEISINFWKFSGVLRKNFFWKILKIFCIHIQKV